jgi:ABC-type branched-subunit amino acid transport system substrate-binding protein
MPRKHLHYMAVIAVCTIAAAACSSSSKPSSTEGSISTSGARPIEVIQAQSVPGDPDMGQAGAEAAISYINSHGGIGGRLIKATYCDGHTLQMEQACGREAAGNPDIVASISNSDFFGGFNPAAPDVPVLACNLYTAADYSAPNCFATVTGSFIVPGSATFGSAALGLHHMVLVSFNSPVGDTAAGEINDVLAPRNEKLLSTVFISPTEMDLSPVIAGLPANTDGVISALTSAQAAQLIIDARQAGKNFPIITTTAAFSAAQMKQLVGRQASNVYAVSYYKMQGPAYNQYESQMAAIGQAGMANDNTIALSSWVGIQMLKALALQIGPNKLTRASLMSAMKSTSSYNTGGLTPLLSWTKPSNSLGGAVPNLINPAEVAYKYDPDTGKYVLYAAYKSGDFFDSFTGG